MTRGIGGNRRLFAGGVVLACGVAAVFAAGGAGLVLFDAPRGAWLAEVRPDAPVVVLEERDGWRHVRVEGWIPVAAGAAPATAAAPEGPAPAAVLAPAVVAAPAPVAPASAAPPAALPAGSGGASVRGVLLPRPGMTPATVGANLVVILVGDLSRLDAEQEALGTRCRGTIQDLDRQIADLEVKVKSALNSTNNFTEASRRYDRAKAERAAAKSARAVAVKGCFDDSDALYDRFAVARLGSDTAGQYEFKGVADGEYRVVARDRQADAVRIWALGCVVAGGSGVTVDPATAPIAPDPYWGLR